ncbi:MAG: ABC transporter permease subunit [Planctomycetes bacterium]|nr:ABC transporter permease subunit [Planctomycetota bacterium]
MLSPRDDHLFALTNRELFAWRIDAPHPEISVRALLGRVWYEGYPEPEHVWQSSSGTDDFEPKYGLMPLIFGTLKATFYSLLFGAPLALLAAVYTSEFLTPRTKAIVKPTIEMMASLPSVVLGFLAALVLAPVVEEVLPELLLAFATVPFAYLFLAKASQIGCRELSAGIGRHLQRLRSAGALKRWADWFIPLRSTALRERWHTAGMILALPLGLSLAVWLGPRVERWLFAGDIMAWLDRQTGSGLGAWFLLLMPLSVLMVAIGFHLWLRPALRPVAASWSRQAFALLDLAIFLVVCAVTVGLASCLATGLTALGWDPRGTVVGTYVQRNALIVGFVMGFAIIPIIYTVAEDALSAVPASLRAASLAAGATPWQTAARVVVPTAMSGLFSSLMIGLGRAVGETMIVLMAAGNTPLMDWNIFNGFRTLSANIAVELPEAVKDSTHYRVLFLAALTLFALTFVVNTVAEVIRLRFRKRAFQL